MTSTELLYGYLAVCLVVLVVILSQEWRSWRRQSPWVREVINVMHPERKTLKYRILGKGVAPLLAGLTVVTAWPVVLVMVIQQYRREKRDLAAAVAVPFTPEEDSEFKLKQVHLMEELNISQVDQRERVIDPLFAVPDLPFGHLHPLWTGFVQKLQPADKIWSFSSQGRTEWGLEEKRKGYAAVRGGVIVESITVEKRVNGVEW